jgi:hypothetical protein
MGCGRSRHRSPSLHPDGSYKEKGGGDVDKKDGGGGGAKRVAKKQKQQSDKAEKASTNKTAAKTG